MPRQAEPFLAESDSVAGSVIAFSVVDYQLSTERPAIAMTIAVEWTLSEIPTDQDRDTALSTPWKVTVYGRGNDGVTEALASADTSTGLVTTVRSDDAVEYRLSVTVVASVPTDAPMPQLEVTIRRDEEAYSSPARDMLGYATGPDYDIAMDESLARWLRHESPTLEPRVAAAVGEPAAVESAEPERWFTADLEDHAANERLCVGEPYPIAFGVDDRERPDLLGQTPVTVPTAGLFEADASVVELAVQVDGADFDVSEHERPLRLRRVGPSLNRARFDVVARHEGDCSLTATFHRHGNFVHQMHLTLRVGEAPAHAVVEGSGRRVTGATSLGRRNVSLILSSSGDAYRCISVGDKASDVRLGITPAGLNAAVDDVRGKLLQVVQHLHEREPVFQRGIDIPVEVEREALRVMARAGARLFQRLFHNPGDGADARALGEWLRGLRSDGTGPLRVQVVSTGVPVPWSLLYLGDVRPGAELSWESFLGMRHLVEQIPYVGSPSHESAVVSSDPQLAVSVNFNTTIDTAMKSTFVTDQKQWWQAAAGGAGSRLAVVSRSTKAELMAALADSATADQIFYFYGHASASSLLDRGGPDASALVLSDGKLTLADLNLDAPDDVQLLGRPLVVLNACESAELSPLFYDGFVPYFLNKGARGVVGTEAKIPAMFASAWAMEFFRRLFEGQTVGAAVFELCRDFIARCRNPLGLFYAVHCDQDTQISPPLHQSHA